MIRVKARNLKMSAEHLAIRLAEMVDAPSVHALLWEARAEIPLADNFDDAAHKKWVVDECRSRRVWVVDGSREVVATMVIKPATKARLTEISYVAVSARARCTGIGTSLVRHAKQKWSNGLAARVKPYNQKMINRLASEGFRCEIDPLADMSACD